MTRQQRRSGGTSPHLRHPARPDHPEQELAPTHPNWERETVREPSEDVAYSGNGAKTIGTCPVCGRAGKFDVTLNEPGARFRYRVGCFVCNARGLVGRAYLDALLDAIGARPNQAGQLLDEGPAFAPLRPLLDGQRVARSARVSLPSLGAVHGWASALFSNDDALAYLTKRRGLSLRIVRRFLIGWDQDGCDLTFPIVAGGEVVNLYRRKPLDGAKVRAARRTPRQPYPNLPTRSWRLLVAGELDALTGRMYGLPAVTVSGKTLPAHSLARFLDRPTAVMFDVGEEPEAEHVTRALRAAGGAAWVVRLARLGLPEDADLNDYHREGGSVVELRELISSERRRAS